MSRLRIALAAVAIVAAVAGACVWKRRVAEERAKRTSPVTLVAPAPLPTGLPLIGAQGQDVGGYPTQAVDRPALRSLLSHGRFDDLTADLEQFQAAFEADPTREYWPLDAADAFASAEPELVGELDQWVAAKSSSFAPYLARATYWEAVAGARRGAKVASETEGEDFAAMRDAIARGLPDADRALSLRPKLVAAMRVKLRLLGFTGGHASEQRRIIDDALAGCPSCFQIRVTYLYQLTPRWGGSYDAMTVFARSAADPTHPRMNLLQGYVDLDEADLLRRDKKYDEALAAVARACALGEHWEFLLGRARIESAHGDAAHALTDLDRAAVLRPGHPDVLFQRAWVKRTLSQWEGAGRDLLDGLRVVPTDEVGRAVFDEVVRGLVFDAWEAFKAGRRDDALRELDLADQLAPTNDEVHQRRNWILAGAGKPNDLGALEQAAKNAPDDFRAQQQLDYALAKQGQFDRILDLWTAYLARHPNDGAAYLERGGTYFQMHRLREAQADAREACDLGVSEGCARAKQLAPMLR